MKGIRTIIALVTAAIVTGCATDSGFRIDNVPMYGQPEIKRPAFLKQADADFIEEASTKIGSHEAASIVWYNQGEKYMAQDNLDFAMRRYNQSWLLNPDNYQPYWGFARVMVAARQYDESFGYFERARQLIDDDCQKPALLTDLAVAYHDKANSLPREHSDERQKFFALANRTFDAATKADATYVKAWLKWAYSLYFQQDYAAAWERIARVRSLDSASVPTAFLQKLQSKMPEPAH